jgi:hypothetical protein
MVPRASWMSFPRRPMQKKRGNHCGYTGAALLPWNRSRPMCRAAACLRRTIRIDGLYGRRPVRRCGVPANTSRLAIGQVALRDRPTESTGLTLDDFHTRQLARSVGDLFSLASRLGFSLCVLSMSGAQSLDAATSNRRLMLAVIGAVGQAATRVAYRQRGMRLKGRASRPQLLILDEYDYTSRDRSVCCQKAATSVLRRCVRRSLARANWLSSAKSLGTEVAEVMVLSVRPQVFNRV